MKTYIFLIITLFFSLQASAQLFSSKQKFTRADSLRGSLRPERTAFDMLKYDLNVLVKPKEKYIQGYNSITFKVLDNQQTLQLDLFDNMKIDSIVYQDKNLEFKREYNAVFIDFKRELQSGKTETIDVYYHGKPIIARNPPWDGGFVFTYDGNGKPWIAVAVQGTRASLWFPNKDHLSDEPDEVDIRITVPKDLVAVSNGRLVEEIAINESLKTYHWQVTYPINNYNITLNIGDYVHFSDQFEDLDLDYYVLRNNLDKAKKHFEQVKPMMDCFYEKLSPYPFERDSFKLVETPYLGMEHQSAVAYGNQYVNGYLGSDLSKTGYGLKFDFIIVHESGHEWFGNSISVKDVADLWIHEGFTTYTEAIFVECEYGKEAALDYIFGQRDLIKNDRPIIGEYGVNFEGSSDMYAKGSNIINTLRSWVNDDELWWKTLKDFTIEFAHKTTTTIEVVDFFSQALVKDLEAFFKQYLAYKNIPKLIFKTSETTKKLQYKWDVDVENFDMPIKIKVNGKSQWLFPKATIWKTLYIKPEQSLDIDIKRFYVKVEFDSE